MEHFRFQDKFDYSISIDEKINLDTYMIPPMLLQPYVENAVWHGLKYKDKKGNLNIIVEEKNPFLSILIEDDGIGREKSQKLKANNQKIHKSKGISNISKRIDILNTMCPDCVKVVISDIETGGTRVELILKKL